MNPGFWLSTTGNWLWRLPQRRFNPYLVFLASWSRATSCLAIFGIFRPAVSSLVSFGSRWCTFGKKSGVCDTTKVVEDIAPTVSYRQLLEARVSTLDWERAWYFYPTACNYGVHNWAVKQLCGNFFRTTSFSRLLSINYIPFRSNPLCLTLN